MLRRRLSTVLAVALLATLSALAAPLGSSFVYQGNLKLDGVAINDSADVQFRLFSADNGGDPIGPVVTVSDIEIVDGLFTANLDFGAGAFNGDARYLEIAVRSPSGVGKFTTLSPRQLLSATPHASWSAAAATVPWSGITGVPENIKHNDSPWSLDNSLLAWGATGDNHDFGQLDVPAGDYIAVTAGIYHSVAIRTDGTLAAWGYSDYGLLDVPDGAFTAVAAGGIHSVAIRTDGTLVAWGNNAFDQCDVPSGKFVAVSAGAFHSLAIRDDGTLAAWGDNGSGQLNVPSGTFTAVAAGFAHSVAIASNGSLIAWGDNLYGQSNVPGGTYTQVVAGFYHNVAMKTDGTLVAWGNNEHGQRTVPHGKFLTIAAGGYHCLAIAPDRTLVAWGSTDDGQSEIPSGTFTAIADGGYHSIALKHAIAYDGMADLPDLRVGRGTVSGDLIVDGHLGIGVDVPRGDVHIARAGVAPTLTLERDSAAAFDMSIAKDGTLRFSDPGVKDLVTVTSDGDVGIGTTVPSGRLELRGPAEDVLLLNGTGSDAVNVLFQRSSGSRWMLGLTPTDDFYIGDTDKLRFRLDRGTGRVYAPGLANIGDYRNVQFNQSTGEIGWDSSSARYKSNIQSFTENFDAVLSLQPRTYTRTAGDPNRWEIGYIAEEVAALGLSSLVEYDPAGVADGVNYEKVSLYVNEVVKRHETAIGELRAENAALTQELDALKQRMAQIEAALRR